MYDILYKVICNCTMAKPQIHNKLHDSQGVLTEWPSVPVQLNLPEGCCIPILTGGIITPVRHEAGEDPDIL
jgi:hypothetical protein